MLSARRVHSVIESEWLSGDSPGGSRLKDLHKLVACVSHSFFGPFSLELLPLYCVGSSQDADLGIVSKSSRWHFFVTSPVPPQGQLGSFSSFWSNKN